MSTLLSVQLSRHPSLRPVERDAVMARHPVTAERGRQVIPETSGGSPPSVFINAEPPHGARGRILPDGRTIEYTSLDPAGLRDLVGRDATLYAYVGMGRRGGGMYRTGRVRVTAPAAADGMFHLVVQPPAMPGGMPPPGRAWADMSDSD